MADLIDREELLKKQKTICDVYYEGKPLNTIQVVSIFDVKEAPAVDAVEVVRCKDCKHRKETDISIVCNRFREINVYFGVDDDDFCKWGEKE